MSFTAGYGTVDLPPAETRTFATREDAQAWLDTITPTLSTPTTISHEPDEAHAEPWEEVVCDWQAWIAADEEVSG